MGSGDLVVEGREDVYAIGDAAVKISRFFKLKPATADGKPVDGGIFQTKITFRLADEKGTAVLKKQ